MPLIYSLVKEEGADHALVDYTAYTGNFSQIALKCSMQLPNAPRHTFTVDRHTFNYERAGSYVFCVVADEDYGRSIPFNCLGRIREDFLGRYGDSGPGAASARSMQEFQGRLREHMNWCMMNPGQVDKVVEVQRRVDDVKNVMVQNIEQVLARGEKIEDLVDKTDQLRFQAESFQKQSQSVRRSLAWQNMKMKLIVISLVLVVLLIIILVACNSLGCW